MVQEDVSSEDDTIPKQTSHERSSNCKQSAEDSRKKHVLGEIQRFKVKTMKRIDAMELAALTDRKVDTHYMISQFRGRTGKSGTQDSRGNITTKIHTSECVRSHANLLSQDLMGSKIYPSTYKTTTPIAKIHKRIRTSASKHFSSKRLNTSSDRSSHHSVSAR